MGDTLCQLSVSSLHISLIFILYFFSSFSVEHVVQFVYLLSMSTLPCVFAACVLTGGDTYVRLLRQVPPKNEPFPGLACAICHGHIYFSKRTPQMRRHCDVTFVRRTMCSTSHAGRTKNTSCFFFSSSLNEMHAIKYHSDIIVEVGMFCCDSKL